MEIAEVTLNGQITIPEGIIEKMSLKRGDKIIFLEENGRFFLENSNSAALSTVQKNMIGAAQEAGFNNSDDVEKYIKQLRKSKRDILITGDKDFDEIKIQKPKIMNARNYIDEYMKSNTSP